MSDADGQWAPQERKEPDVPGQGDARALLGANRIAAIHTIRKLSDCLETDLSSQATSAGLTETYITLDVGGAQVRARVQALVYAEAIQSCFEAAEAALMTQNDAKAADHLQRASTLAAVQAAEVAMQAAPKAETSVGGSSGPPTPPTPPNELPEGIRKLLRKLGEFGAWILSLAASLMTPKSWSIEGGAEIPLLARGKVSITFGD